MPLYLFNVRQNRSQKMSRKAFFDFVRREPFGGKLEPWQVDGLSRILDYRDAKWPKMSDDELAYLLATVFHETAPRHMAQASLRL